MMSNSFAHLPEDIVNKIMHIYWSPGYPFLKELKHVVTQLRVWGYLSDADNWSGCDGHFEGMVEQAVFSRTHTRVLVSG